MKTAIKGWTGGHLSTPNAARGASGLCKTPGHHHFISSDPEVDTGVGVDKRPPVHPLAAHADRWVGSATPTTPAAALGWPRDDARCGQVCRRPSDGIAMAWTNPAEADLHQHAARRSLTQEAKAR